jgi:alkylation response protein AidB-like acyl-CoA dehydrogenase
MATTAVDFVDCRVPAEYLLMPEGVAFPSALRAIDIARVFVGAMGSGAMTAALRVATTYANERQQFGRPLAEFQGLRWLLAELATAVTAGRGLTYQAAASFDSGEGSAVLAAMAKLHVGGKAAATIEQCAQVLGANGYAGDTLLDRLWRQSRMLAIVDGTNEIQREVIGKGLLNAGSAPELPLVPRMG